ncbi:Uncharacterized protein Rs2_34078 [Raphanus sativus]|uniref:Uncharacterized protein LOC108814963 n=1 Tax=Raphanus sativus TaxID=3726 RepID=A0A6J0K6L2_RAPSA|nr:uncharacterized protein LOC108814963 [Raphanus sativus]KAJ4883985.1 Uncharacterized protein Rs2_34078 [Raphanus sativus]
MNRYGRKDQRNCSYMSSDDSDSDCEAQPNHKLSRFVGNVAEKVVQPFEKATKMVVNPVFNFLFSPPKHGKKGKHGRHEDEYYGEHRMQHYREHRMQHNGSHGKKYQDRFMAPQVPPNYDSVNPSHGNGRAVVEKSSEYSRASNTSWGHH